MSLTNSVVGKPSLVIIKMINVAQLFAKAYEETEKLSLGYLHLIVLFFIDKHFRASTVTDRGNLVANYENSATDGETPVSNHENLSIENENYETPRSFLQNSTEVQNSPIVRNAEPIVVTSETFSKIISSFKIIPLPQAEQIPSNKNKGEVLKSIILTGSPFKIVLEMSPKLKEANEKNQRLEIEVKRKNIRRKSIKTEKNSNEKSKNL